MTKDRERLSSLIRRMNHLALRTEEGRNRELSYDCQEMFALRWAIKVCKEWIEKEEMKAGIVPRKFKGA